MTKSQTTRLLATLPAAVIAGAAALTLSGCGDGGDANGSDPQEQVERQSRPSGEGHRGADHDEHAGDGHAGDSRGRRARRSCES